MARSTAIKSYQRGIASVRGEGGWRVRRQQRRVRGGALFVPCYATVHHRGVRIPVDAEGRLRTLAQSETGPKTALPTRLALLRTEDVTSAMANHRTNAMARKVAAALTDWVESRRADFRTLSS